MKTAGGFESAGDADYFNLLVRGFRKGHLYLDRAPAPELAALKDPYDPAQNDRYRLADATYFQGRYYLYFGAAPAVVLLWPYAALDLAVNIGMVNLGATLFHHFLQVPVAQRVSQIPSDTG